MSDTIESFCDGENISRSTYYKLKKLGKAPREMKVLSGVRISPEARAEWRAAREAEAAKTGEAA